MLQWYQIFNMNNLKQKKNKNDAITDLLDIEKQKLQHFTTIKENSQEKKILLKIKASTFLMSLVSYLQQIPDS